MLSRHLTLPRYAGRQLARIVLHVLDMRLDLKVQLLQVLNDRALDRLTKVGMMIGNDAGLVANVVVDVLKTVLAEELVSGSEGNLDDCAEFGEFFSRVVLDVGDTLEVGNELFGDGLPGSKPKGSRRRGTMAVRIAVSSKR